MSCPKEYYCPKCKTKMTSSVRLEYCVCGGKYETDAGQLMKDFEDMFGFSDVFKANKEKK